MAKVRFRRLWFEDAKRVFGVGMVKMVHDWGEHKPLWAGGPYLIGSLGHGSGERGNNYSRAGRYAIVDTRSGEYVPGLRRKLTDAKAKVGELMEQERVHE